jgi:hypothetical protein
MSKKTMNPHTSCNMVITNNDKITVIPIETVSGPDGAAMVFLAIAKALGKVTKGLAKKVGNTGYLDKVQFTDVKVPVGVWMDIHSRPAVTMRIRIKNRGDLPRDTVITVFQRYTEDSSIWVTGTCYNDLPGFGGRITDELFGVLCRLMRDGRVDYEYETFLGEMAKSHLELIS